MTTKKKKVALNIATLIISMIVIAWDIAYIAGFCLSYFMEIPKGMIREILLKTDGTFTGCLIFIIALCVLALTIKLITHPVRNLFGEAKRQMRRRRA